MESLSLAIDMWALWFINLVLVSLLVIFLYGRILRLSTKLSISNAKIQQLEKSLHDSVYKIDVTLHDIMEEMQQSSSAADDAQMSINPPIDTCVIELVENWLDKSHPKEELERKQPQDESTTCDAWGIKESFYDSLGNYSKYPLKQFQFKCLQGRDPNTWPLPYLDEGSLVPTEGGSLCNV